MRFRTSGSTIYELLDVEPYESRSDLYTGKLARISNRGMIDYSSGQELENTLDFYEVLFPYLPQVGYSFSYQHPIYGGCISTPVSEFLNEGD